MNRFAALRAGAPRIFPTVLAVFAVIIVGGCSPAQSQGGPGGPPPVSVAPAVERTLQTSEDFSARIEALETVELRSRVAGTLERVHFREGQRVAKGALLFTIDSRPFAADLERAEAQVAAARTQADLAEAERVRAEKLLPLKAVSQQEMDQLRAAERNAGSTLRAAQAALTTAQLNLGYSRITAPVAGRISSANVTPGNLVGVGDPVLSTVVASDKVYVWFDASEASYLRLRAAIRAGAAAPTVAVGLADEQGHPHKGTVDFVDNRLNPATGSIRVRAVLDNKDGHFTPGLSARVRLASGEAAPATLVPDRAIGTDQTRKVVMVVGANNIVTPREVKLGALADGMRVVTGLKAGELIIVDGLQRAFPGAPVTPTVLKVDDKGMPIVPPPQPPGGEKK
ncbi:MAG: efflux RND transporter periplasmic adaptor subunit [Aquincola sp.]|nr:efflux RND transporter periplasmic adaptor subunit [Aquincola sp.]MDH5328416.1 efflux RND transporter periplasmic adaptor subunit [Aquincola sp.]